MLFFLPQSEAMRFYRKNIHLREGIRYYKYICERKIIQEKALALFLLRMKKKISLSGIFE